MRPFVRGRCLQAPQVQGHPCGPGRSTAQQCRGRRLVRRRLENLVLRDEVKVHRYGQEEDLSSPCCMLSMKGPGHGLELVDEAAQPLAPHVLLVSSFHRGTLLVYQEHSHMKKDDLCRIWAALR